MALIWTIACFALMIVMYLIYQSIKWGSEEHKWQEWFFKGAATAMSALLAGYGFFSRPSSTALLILIGLCVCVAADVILDRHFLAGTAAFSLSIAQKPLLMLGALLFAGSDVMLLFRIVKNIPSKRYDYLCLGCYFLAQFLIAASTVF